MPVEDFVCLLLIVRTQVSSSTSTLPKVGDYTEEEFLREFVEERTEDEEYDMDSRRIAQVEESSGVG